MKISKNKKDGWREVVALKSGTIFCPPANAIVKGNKYFVQGDIDPAIFAYTSKPKAKEVKK